ncbi:MAG: hypothetical protein OQK82_08295 [Candidatus Pacearchaeota archaeon]|nr:hypothetical protein [Candidatus Pacearchaeota archaeon]
MTKNKSNKKDWIYVSIILIVIFGVIIATNINWDRFFGLSSEMKTKLDYYDDQLSKCNSDISSLYKSGNDLSQVLYKLTDCEEIIDDAKIDINSWARDKKSDEIEVARLDYEMSSDSIDVYYILFNIIGENYATNEDYLNAINSALNLLDDVENNYNKIKSEYSKTEYFERYYLSKGEQINESEEGLKELRNQFLETKNALLE